MASLFYFIITLAVLIAVHEFGHFWVAKRCGVKVLKFSIGFGKPLWKKTGRDGTEYILAAIPLGGFVKMLDEREGDVSDSERHRAFNTQPLSSRFAIVAAGPLANLLFAVLAYWLVFMMGISGVRSIVGDVIPSSPAAEAGLQSNDEIIAINDEVTPTWLSVRKALAGLSVEGGEAELVVMSSGVKQEKTLSIPKIDMSLDEPTSILQTVGVKPVQIALKPVIDKVLAGGAAEKAGLKQGDTLLAANGVDVGSWQQWVEVIRSHPNKTLLVQIKRAGEIKDIVLTPLDNDGQGQIGVSVDAKQTSIPQALKSELRFGLVTSLQKAVITTWQTSVLITKSLIGMLTGDVSTKNIGGPISIAQFAGSSAANGFSVFIGFLAVISISLGILNLLPIPVLDGGHLLFFIIEGIRGAPLSDQAQVQGQKVGLVILLSLMFLAFFNDLTRLFG